jgi:hypothetical protein
MSSRISTCSTDVWREGQNRCVDKQPILDGKRLVMRADEKLTAFWELKSYTLAANGLDKLA